MKVVERKITEFIRADYNPRKITIKKMDELKKSNLICLIMDKQAQIKKLIDCLGLVPTFTFGKEDYDKEEKEISLPIGDIVPFIKFERENGRDLVPVIHVISPSGKTMEFDSPHKIFSGMRYWDEKKEISVRLCYK